METTTACFTAFIFVCAALILLSLVFTFMKQIVRFLVAIIANSIVGLVVLGILNLAGIGIPLTLPVLVSTALFGLGGIGTILIFLFFGVKLQ